MRPTPSTTEGLTSTLTMARMLPAATRRRSLLLAGEVRQRRRGAACVEPSWMGSAAPGRRAAAAGAGRPASRHWGRAVRLPSRILLLLWGVETAPGLRGAASALAAACIVARPPCTPPVVGKICVNAAEAAGPKETRPAAALAEGRSGKAGCRVTVAYLYCMCNALLLGRTESFPSRPSERAFFHARPPRDDRPAEAKHAVADHF